jgi:hypothetical protein
MTSTDLHGRSSSTKSFDTMNRLPCAKEAKNLLYITDRDCTKINQASGDLQKAAGTSTAHESLLETPVRFWCGHLWKSTETHRSLCIRLI